MKLIPLTKGLFAKVSNKDFKYLSQWKWYAHKSRDTFYAQRNISTGIKKQTTLIMHRVILMAADGQFVDHADCDGLNNTRKNIRICSLSQNAKNRKHYKGSTSKYKGVHYFRKNRKWVAYVNSNKIRFHLGYFDNPEDAAKAYNFKAKELHGKFARLNNV